MFSISRKGDYGLLLLSILAKETLAGRPYLSLNEVAQNRKLSAKFLSHIAHDLKEAGILISKEGRDGGYGLAREASKITLVEVIEALEGPLAPVACCSGQKTVFCEREKDCTVRPLWQAARQKLVRFLSKKTIADTIC